MMERQQWTHLLAVISFMGLVSPTSGLDCRQFPGPQTGPSLRCVLDNTPAIPYPQSVGGIGVAAYHYTGARGQFAPSVEEHRLLELVPDIAHKVLPTFSGFASGFNSTVILIPTLPDGHLGETVSTGPGLELCYTRVARPGPGLSDTSLAQLVTHEWYHCVQGRERRRWFANIAPNQWWVDGSADYFAELFYPSNPTTTSWRPNVRSYAPDTPLWNKTYEASAFFLALANQGWTADQINDVVRQRTESSSPADERRSLAASASLAGPFHVFATQFFSGELRDSSGAKIDLFHPISAKVFSSPLAADGAQSAQPFRRPPWTLNAFSTAVGKGLDVTLSFASADAAARLQYQAAGAERWEMLPPGSQASLSTPCDDAAGGKTTYNFLVTSTSARDASEGTILLRRNRKRRCSNTCASGGGFVLYPLLNATTSGAACPPGTRFGSRSAWCCPPGTDLDQAAAREVSICCPTPVPAGGCSRSIVPNALRCADPSWVLWSKQFRQVGCCLPGYYPNSQRFCVRDPAARDRGYTTVAQAPGANPTGTCSPPGNTH